MAFPFAYDHERHLPGLMSKSNFILKGFECLQIPLLFESLCTKVERISLLGWDLSHRIVMALVEWQDPGG